MVRESEQSATKTGQGEEIIAYLYLELVLLALVSMKFHTIASNSNGTL